MAAEKTPPIKKRGRPLIYSERMVYIGVKLQAGYVRELKATAKERGISASALMRERLNPSRCSGCMGYHRHTCPTR